MAMICSFKQNMSKYLDVCEFMISDNCIIYPNRTAKLVLRGTENARKNITRALSLINESFGQDKLQHPIPLSKHYKFDVWCYTKKCFHKDLTIEAAQSMSKIIGLGETKPEYMICECYIESSKQETPESLIELVLCMDYVLGHDFVKQTSIPETGIDIANMLQEDEKPIIKMTANSSF